MKTNVYITVLLLLSGTLYGQNCSILSKANNITPDRLCSPVTAVWFVSYTGVNDAGTDVSIRYDWDNGFVETVPATEVSPGVFEATSTITYTSAGDVCNYHPRATLMVNGVLCTSTSQEQIVTVWDNDDSNGGEMHIYPEIYPICFGTSANVRFQDVTQFNCVPPQESDNPNVNTRWIQWIYGTDNTMTGTPVTIEGTAYTWPHSGSVITLTGPVTGSGLYSGVINVAADKAVGEYFEVTLRNWNYCNPYDDPNIPGLPADPVNGDNAPVETTARILIVPYPDATITPVAPMCENAGTVTLTAHDAGGTWSGPGVSGNTFNPATAGPGNHAIRYDITDANSCSDFDITTITVYPVPDATILSGGIVCSSDPPFTLVAVDPGGIWTGPGVTGNTFDPAIPGAGNHTVTYTITDTNGCTGYDETIITVATPDATITPVDTLCNDSAPVTLTAVDLGGAWSGPGVIGNRFHPIIAGTGDHKIKYSITNADCKDADSIIITVMPIPVITIDHPGTQYITGDPVTLTATPQGGIWSGPGVTGNQFDPDDAGTGTHVIWYETIPDRWGCMAADTIQIRVMMPQMPEAAFDADSTGCAPFTVSFTNQSRFGSVYTWEFGDGLYSNEKDPVHTYYTPGEYLVKLTVSNITGQAVTFGRVTVYQNPVALFTAFPNSVVNNKQIVIFSNSSQYDSTYLWRFGDGETSTEESPWHQYKEPGEYNVWLTVTSADGCIDSTRLETPIFVKWLDGDINFANAFRWNRSGPTGGRWQEGVYDGMDFVFRPFVENVISYQLQIFNRWGVLIYESRELNNGWDGYIKEGTLAPQGVYVYKVTGQYADGSYFEKVGDVTFLH
ncbi:MAG: PKD domain-containing protein [Bacteroidales bacterium]|nr:PKD domain-containing protein [Bacteroidales bacterium]